MLEQIDYTFKPGMCQPVPVRIWFLKIVSLRMCVCMCVCVCVSPPLKLLITGGVIWTPYDWLNKFYGSYMAVVVGIVNGHGLGIVMSCRNSTS